MVVLHFGRLEPEIFTLPSFGRFCFDEGAYRLGMDFAAWRCASKQDLLCSSSSPNDPGGPMETGLELLNGRTVRALRLSQQSLDLELKFEGDLTFSIFCDQVNLTDGRDNYSFRCKTGVFIVGPGSKLRFEPSSAL
jgi:hypothetical protein